MDIFFVDWEQNALYIHMLDTRKGDYNLSYRIEINEEYSIRDAVYGVIIRAIRKKPNQVIFKTVGMGASLKDSFHDILSKIDFIKSDEKGNMKYVLYLSPEQMELIVKGMRVDEKENQSNTNR